MKNLTSICIVCLLGIGSSMQSAYGDSVSSIKHSNQERIELLHKYQMELHALKTKVKQLETEVFLGGYNDLIERYQEIIRQLEYDIKQANSFSESYSSFVKHLKAQKDEIDDLNSSINRNNFFLLIASFFSMIAMARATN
jgi:predicted RNase H-like nuclease (RuvC/YqgF family)